MKKKWFALLIAVLTIIMTACGKGEIKDAVNWPVGEFEYTNQNGDSFGLKDLKGKVWVADFIFTNCADVCPPMTNNMKKLQDKTKKEGIKNIQFVSFSVDPTVDTPEILKKYADNYDVNYKTWNFLTGYTQKEIENFAKDSFKSLVVKPETGDQVAHYTYFYLVGPEGKVLKYYTGLNDIPYEDIIKDIKTLQ
ncbi:SCO family protein [Bacillus sp. CGMCC 1.16607]|uniref:SCO family protein n=1 Tax=Bacillus sp. CGMCC 1.16607 TaxID=3351842 RepID=UPI0036301CC7